MNKVERKILIIDDEVDLCLLMKNYFVRKNFRVYYAHTLREGMQMMKEVNPDIVFLDNNLPDGTGWSKSDYFTSVNPSLRLFLMSGYQPNLPELQYPYEVIYKPISFKDLEILANSN